MRVACVQTDVVFGDPLANVAVMEEHVQNLAREGVQLAIFPECFLTGYCVGSREEADSIVLDLGHEAVARARQIFLDTGVALAFGFAEKWGQKLANSSYIIAPGVEKVYRKTHLPCLGFDRFATGGDWLDVVPVFEAKVGPLICYDLRPPEATRTLTLKGADLLALPTNWPEGAETSAEIICRARAAENRIFVATCNRIGVEKGFRFIGRSKIIGVSGEILAAAGDGPEVLIADLDLNLARQKRTVNIPGEYELEILGCRRPELYSPLVR